MKTLIAAALMLSQIALASEKTYQVTGPVTDVTDTTITVQKGQDKWVLKKDATTAAKGDIKVGSKVTVEYTMTATTIEAKQGKKK